MSHIKTTFKPPTHDSMSFRPVVSSSPDRARDRRCPQRPGATILKDTHVAQLTAQGRSSERKTVDLVGRGNSREERSHKTGGRGVGWGGESVGG